MNLVAGTRLGPYEITAPLGSGGMGHVYRARDTKLGREVAVKVLSQRLASDPDVFARFEREAKAVATLSHPHILAIHDFGSHEGMAYAAMELLEGETLRERLDGGPLPLRKALEYAAQIAQGLAAAHDKEIVHRDLKPENVFLTRDGRVKILDFGLARQGNPLDVGDDAASPIAARHTEPGTVLGTVGYMSPEQAKGLYADQRSDLFSLGAILYEMVLGRRAFRRDSAVETLNAVLKEDPLEVPEAANLPPAVERVLRHCLEKGPDERFQSARDLAFDLASLAGLSISGPAAVSAQRAALPPQLARRAALLLAAAALFAAGFWLRGRATPVPGAIAGAVTRLTDEQGSENEPALSPDGKTLVYVAGPLGHRDIYSRRVGGRNPINLTKDCAADDDAPAYAPDGERLAYRSECGGGGIFVMGATGESAKRASDAGFDPAWSPDGLRIAVAGERIVAPLARLAKSTLSVIELSSGERRELMKGDAVQPAWSPNGYRIAYWSRREPGGQRDVWTIAADGAGAAVPVTNDVALDWSPVWSPDGRYLYYSSYRGGTMNLWRVPIEERSGRLLGDAESLGLPAIQVGRFALSRDGKSLAYTAWTDRAALRTIDFDAARETTVGAARLVLQVPDILIAPEWSQSGDWLAITQWAQRETVEILHPDGSGLRKLSDDGFRNRAPRFAPDDGRIAFYSDRDGRYEVWAIRPDGSGLEQLSNVPEGVIWAIWSPGGTHIATSRVAGGGLYILDLRRPIDERAERIPPPPGVDDAWPQSWSSDGDTLLLQSNAPDGLYDMYLYSFSAKSYRKLEARGRFPTFLSDGRRFLVGGRGRVLLVDSRTGRSKDILPPGMVTPETDVDVAVSKDDRRLAVVERVQEMDVWMTTLR